MVEDAKTPLRSGGSRRSGFTRAHFSSATDEWATPQEFFDRCHALWDFTLDPCSTHNNAKCRRHFTRQEDGLKQPWVGERVWMNPPYGRQIGNWMRKAFLESQRGALVVCLVPARTDTAWWHDYAARGEILFIRGRLRFGGAVNSAPFPSALVIFDAANHPTQAGENNAGKRSPACRTIPAQLSANLGIAGSVHRRPVSVCSPNPHDPAPSPQQVWRT